MEDGVAAERPSCALQARSSGSDPSLFLGPCYISQSSFIPGCIPPILLVQGTETQAILTIIGIMNHNLYILKYIKTLWNSEFYECKFQQL